MVLSSNGGGVVVYYGGGVVVLGSKWGSGGMVVDSKGVG